MRLGWGVAVLVGTSACLALGAPAAHADAPVDSGWWTQANPGAPAPVPAVAPPDVPADGLLVQGGATDPVAFAGLIYEPEAGATAQQLVLKVAPSTATTPNAVLKLCALTGSSLNAEQGGPIADAPAYDCARSVTAAADDGGTRYTFSLRTLASSGSFGLAVLPTAPTDRVVLAKPGADSLVTSAPPVTFSPAPFPTEPSLRPEPLAPVAQPPVVGTGQLPGTVPSAAPAPSLAPETPTDAPVQASVVPAVNAAASSHDHHAVVGAGLLAALATGCGLWAFAGRNPLEPLPTD